MYPGIPTSWPQAGPLLEQAQLPEDQELDQLVTKGVLDQATADQVRARRSGAAAVTGIGSTPQPSPTTTLPAKAPLPNVSEYERPTLPQQQTKSAFSISVPTVSTAGFDRLQREAGAAAKGYQGKLGGVQEQMGAGARKESEGLTQQYQAQAQAAREREEALKGQYEQETAHAAKVAEVQSRRQQRMTDDQAKLERAQTRARYFGLDDAQIDQYQATLADPNAAPEDKDAARAGLKKGEEIDPDRALGGAAKKVTAALAIMFGAVGAAFGNGRNVALDILDSQIEQDIEAQRQKASSRRADVGEAQSLLERNRQLFDDEMQATEATRIAMLNATKAKMDQIAAGSESQEVLGKAQQAAAQIDQRIAESQAKLIEAGQNSEMQRIGQESQLEQAKMQGRQFNVKARLEAAEMQGKGGALTVPGLKGATGNKEIQKQVMAQKSTVDGLLGDIRSLKSFVFGEKGVGREVFSTDSAQVAQQKARSLQLQLKNIYQLGVLSDSDMQMLEQIVPADPTQWRQGSVKARLDELERSIKDKSTSYFKAHGFSDESQEKLPTQGAAL